MHQQRITFTHGKDVGEKKFPSRQFINMVGHGGDV